MNRIGDFAQLDFQAMRLAEQMQALAVSYINDAYFAEEDITIDNLTPAKFIAELEKARDGGPVAQFEFNRMLGKIIEGVIPQVMQPQQQQGGAPNGR